MKNVKIIFAVLVSIFLLNSAVLASPKGSGGDQAKGSGSMTYESEPGVALEGYCPVAINKGMAMKGKDYFVTKYKGKIYKFAKFEAQKAFLNDPEKYLEDIESKVQKVKGSAMEKGSEKGSQMHKGSGSHKGSY